jgi:hypothetical protein
MDRRAALLARQGFEKEDMRAQRIKAGLPVVLRQDQLGGQTATETTAADPEVCRCGRSTFHLTG